MNEEVAREVRDLRRSGMNWNEVVRRVNTKFCTHLHMATMRRGLARLKANGRFVHKRKLAKKRADRRAAAVTLVYEQPSLVLSGLKWEDGEMQREAAGADVTVSRIKFPLGPDRPLCYDGSRHVLTTREALGVMEAHFARETRRCRVGERQARRDRERVTRAIAKPNRVSKKILQLSRVGIPRVAARICVELFDL